jgi:SAM-dependent methyltransferase
MRVCHGMKRARFPRPRLIDLVEGYYVTRVLDALHHEGVLRSLAKGQAIDAVARERGLDVPLLRSLLEYAALRSDMVDLVKGRDGDRFRVSAAYAQTALPAHLLDQYVGAYGPCLDRLKTILRAPAKGASLVDRDRHAMSFAGATGGANHSEIAQIVQELEITFLLDLGCGPGLMLKDLARNNADFSGVGVDANPYMVRSARKDAAAMGLGRRIHFLHGGAFQLARITKAKMREKVQAITAMSLVNGFFSEGTAKMVRFLIGLRKLFPRRILIIGDYYGRLGSPSRRRHGIARSLLHDVAQLVSGQGVPPHHRFQWKKIYREASCTLIKELEGEHNGIARFIHLIQL